MNIKDNNAYEAVLTDLQVHFLDRPFYVCGCKQRFYDVLHIYFDWQ